MNFLLFLLQFGMVGLLMVRTLLTVNVWIVGACIAGAGALIGGGLCVIALGISQKLSKH